MFNTIVLVIFNVVVMVFLGFSLGMLYHSKRVRKTISRNKVLLDEVQKLEDESKALSESDEDKQRKFDLLIESKGKLEYIRGRLDLVGELMD